MTTQKKALAKKEAANKGAGIQADDLISFRQLSKKAAGGDADDVSSSSLNRRGPH